MAPLRSELGGPLKERPLESAGLGLRSRCLRRPEILPNHDARLYLNVRARAEIVWYSPPLAFRTSGSHEPLESHHDSQGLMSERNSELLKVLHVSCDQGGFVLKSSSSDQSVNDGALDTFLLRTR